MAVAGRQLERFEHFAHGEVESDNQPPHNVNMPLLAGREACIIAVSPRIVGCEVKRRNEPLCNGKMPLATRPAQRIVFARSGGMAGQLKRLCKPLCNVQVAEFAGKEQGAVVAKLASGGVGGQLQARSKPACDMQMPLGTGLGECNVFIIAQILTHWLQQRLCVQPLKKLQTPMLACKA